MTNIGLEYEQLESVPTDMALYGTYFFYSLAIQPPFHPQIWNIFGYFSFFLCALLKEFLISYFTPFYQLSIMHTHLGAD